MPLTLGATPLVLSIGDTSLTLALGVAVTPAAARLPRLIALTEDTTLVSASRGNVYTNTGAAGTVVASLPASTALDALSAAYAVRFRVTAEQLLRVKAQGTDVIRWSGVESAAAGYLEASDRDATLDVEYVGGGVFLVVGAQREWSFGP